ncbi:MAG: 50S ribosomal protein L6, partial [Nitrospinota bacterium]|nr:50S ribosomal protein L6 [Nitrospinota bacterium]
PRPKLEIVDGQIIVTRPSESRQDKSLHGLTRSLVANMVEGVTKGYEKELEIIGLGYRVEADGKGLILNVGYSHSVKIAPIGGIEFEVQSDRQRNAIKV